MIFRLRKHGSSGSHHGTPGAEGIHRVNYHPKVRRHVPVPDEARKRRAMASGQQTSNIPGNY